MNVFGCEKSCFFAGITAPGPCERGLRLLFRGNPVHLCVNKQKCEKVGILRFRCEKSWNSRSTKSKMM